ncbi:MAG: ATP-binding protein, partial [Fibrella sp.]|nr:ATP-binding protein [Armatimonadota bacterium]
MPNKSGKKWNGNFDRKMMEPSAQTNPNKYSLAKAMAVDKVSDYSSLLSSDSFRYLIEQLPTSSEALSRVRKILHHVTGNKLSVCESEDQLPLPFPVCEEVRITSPIDLRRVRRAVQTVTDRLHFSEERAYDLIAAVSEGAMNAIVHASAGSATICVHPDGDEIQVWIRDNGNGIAVTHLHRATLECGFTTSDSLGCGFFIILNTIDS